MPTTTRDSLTASMVEENEHGTVCKVLCGGPLLAGHAVYTSAVTPGQVDQPGTAAIAHQFQAKVKKAFEVRLTVVGHQLFAARIDSASVAGHQDWRTDQLFTLHWPGYAEPGFCAPVPRCGAGRGGSADV